MANLSLSLCPRVARVIQNYFFFFLYRLDPFCFMQKRNILNKNKHIHRLEDIEPNLSTTTQAGIHRDSTINPR